LRRVLTIDDAVSTLFGVALLVAAEPIATFLGLSNANALRVLGVVCLGFAALVWSAAREASPNRGRVLLIAALNGISVLACDAILLFDPFKLSDGGKIMVLIAALGMAVLGWFEWQGARRS